MPSKVKKWILQKYKENVSEEVNEASDKIQVQGVGAYDYDSLSKIIDIEKTKELKFKKFKSSLLSMQRKFILTDKILFRSR